MDAVHTSRPEARRGAPFAGRRLTRDAVIARAVQLIEHQGYATFSLRALAETLEVRPNALYNHIRNRDDLLDAIAEQFVATIRLPDKEEPWPDWVGSVATGLHAQLVEHPELTEVLLSRAGSTTAGPKVLREFLDRLVAAGIDRAVAHVAWHTMLTVVIGSAQQERARGADRGPTFETILEVIRAGLVTAAERPPSNRAVALLNAHSLAYD